jgi:hypothetical protein
MNEVDGSVTAGQKAVTAERRYAEICSNIRATDEISFKLLGLVPLVSGTGIVVLLDRSREPAWSPIAVFVAVFGAVISYAIYRWELRNIQTCNWLIDRAADLERDELRLAKGQFYNRDAAPKVFGHRMGKTQAVHLLYGTTIAAWLLLPVIAAATHYLR